MADAPWDIAIVGCGPTGLVLATLLGQLGCRVCVLERDEEVQPVARATHIDEETLRNLQATGLMHELLPHTQPFGRFEIVDAAGRRLLRAEVASPPFVDGYDGSRYFDQPAFERILRAGLRRYPSVVLETGAAALDVEDAGSHAVVRARTPRGESEILARWVVGCDGGRSLVRRAIGSQMRSFAPRRRWLIVDTVLRDPSSARLLPDCFQYVLEERGLSIYAHGFGQNRRWELELPAAAPVPSDEEVVRWLARRVDPALLRIVRIAPYTHNASVATRWRVGRVLLAGDAAHMMPPSTGQGLCSGVRDATNLAWKLHRVVTGLADERLLDTYQQERARCSWETGCAPAPSSAVGGEACSSERWARCRRCRRSRGGSRCGGRASSASRTRAVWRLGTSSRRSGSSPAAPSGCSTTSWATGSRSSGSGCPTRRAGVRPPSGSRRSRSTRTCRTPARGSRGGSSSASWSSSWCAPIASSSVAGASDSSRPCSRRSRARRRRKRDPLPERERFGRLAALLSLLARSRAFARSFTGNGRTVCGRHPNVCRAERFHASSSV
jgi:2-polyprenyl-6-methoxyphenol hydroxylase-like FAD-dependent oxidoreductase